MSSPTPGTVGLVGLVALYGAYEFVTRDRIRLEKYDHGNSNYLTWEHDGILLGGSTFVLFLIGIGCLWHWWTHRK
jgi:hypothetical protein